MDVTQLLNSINEFSAPLGQFLKNWWWFPLPFILWKPFLFVVLWWRRELFIRAQKIALLEISLPREVQKPIRAMESVMTSIHAALYHPYGNWWEQWVDGQVQLSIGFEIASFGGETHFYVRTPVQYREAVEASLYSQYSEIEIKEVDDYTKYVPQNIPNKEWNLFGGDYRLITDDHYPLKTFKQFETEHEVEEQRIIDPVAVLLESMAKIKPEEQLWIQFSVEPMGDAGPLKATPAADWIKKGEALRDKISYREEKKAISRKPIIEEALQILITGKPDEPKKEEPREIIPAEMKLTPGEKEKVQAIEIKMSKLLFKCTARFIYLGKRDVFFKPNFRLVFVFFQSFCTNNLNAIYVLGAHDTLTKIYKSWFLPLNWFQPRRAYLRCRKMFRNYIQRFPAFWPNLKRAELKRAIFVLGTEELASLFHFPGELVAPAPGVSRVVKKGSIPPDLPIEE